MNEENATEEDEIIDRSGHKWWLKTGLTWGLLMWVSMCIVLPIYTDVPFSLRLVLFTLPSSLVGGLLFGFGMKLIKKYLKPVGQKRTKNIS